MSKLSLILWLSDVANGLGIVATIFAIFGNIGAVVFTVLGCCWHADDYREYVREEFAAVRKRCGRVAVLLWPVALISTLVAVVTPSKSTVMMIAATEAAVTVAQTPAAQEIMGDTTKLIQQWLKSQLKEDRK